MTPGRKLPSLLKRRDCRFDPRNNVIGVLGVALHHDGGDHIILMVAPGNPQSGDEADRRLGYIFDLDEYAIELTQDDFLNVIDVGP